MTRPTRRTFVVSAAALAALAGCGGGGSGNGLPDIDPSGGTATPAGPPRNTNPVATLTPSATRLVAFPGDTKQLSAIGRDAAGATVTAPTIAWTSSDPSVATVDASGKVTVVSAATGSANIVASSGTATVAVPLSVQPTPATVAALKAAFPFERAEPGATGAVSSDIAQTWTDAQALRLKAITAQVSTLLSKPSDPLDFFFTTDRNVLVRHAARIGGLSAADVAAISNIVQIGNYDGSGRIATFYALGSAEDPDALTMMMHESAEFTLDANVRQPGGPEDAQGFGWLREGLGLHVEGGTVDATNTYRWSKPTARVVTAFKANALANAASADVSVLKTKTYNEVVGTDPVNRTTAYAASGMLVSFLVTRYPATFRQLLDELSAGGAGGAWPPTREGLMARLVALLAVASPPLATEAALSSAYIAWGLAQPA